jgi:FMN reductase (NADPH)
MNHTLDLINKRRSTRTFSDRPISEETLLTLKEATLRAPTAGNMALYSIVEVTDQAKKDQLAIICDNQPMIGKAPIVWVFLADMQKWVNYFKESGAVARADEAGHAAWRAPGLGDLHLCMQDAIIAAQNAVIAGEALGLGSCYIGDVIENFEDLRSLLDLKQYTIPAAMLIFGYPAQTQSTKQSPRCPVDAIFMENRYKEPHLGDLERAFSVHEEARRRVGALPYDNTATLADYYYLRKHTSAFMAEMDRSTRVMFDWWQHG